MPTEISQPYLINLPNLNYSIERLREKAHKQLIFRVI